MNPTILLAADNPLGHVVDKVLLSTSNGTPILTMHMVTLVAAALIAFAVLWQAGRRIETGQESEGADRYLTRGRIPQVIEVICLYLREKVVRPQLGDATDRYIPYLWATFFFILLNNLFGLVPLMDLQHLIGALGWNDSHFAVIGGTATGNIAITGAMALIAFFIIQAHGLRENGLVGYLKHLTAGTPVALWIVMVPVEILGTVIKPFALAIRLFANMVAGHTLLATLLMFTKMSLEGVGLFGGAPITLVAVVSAVPIMFLEVFVAFLQAFVFMFLVTVFIAQLSHHHHDDHAHGHDHAHPHEPTLAGGAH